MNGNRSSYLSALPRLVAIAFSVALLSTPSVGFRGYDEARAAVGGSSAAVGGSSAVEPSATRPETGGFLEDSDWPDWRGPHRDGVADAAGLPESWSREGENLAWVVPYGGRSAPIVLGDHLYLQNGSGDGETLQERVLCFNADTGELLWEHRFNIFMSDVPPHRVGWASPAADPETGTVYAFGVGGSLLALSRDGELLWERHLSEMVGLITTHGGRTVSPVVEAGTVIVSGLNGGWGNQAPGRHRFFGFDKQTGDIVWVSANRDRSYDTVYSPPIVINQGPGRVLITGGGDGAVHAMQVYTGKRLWRYAMSKRGINTGVALSGYKAIVTHSEENLATSDMGFIAAIDTRAGGELGEDAVLWSTIGHMAGFSSPVLDGNRFYQVDNSANLVALDIDSGERLWVENLGTIQRASPVLADGKLYVGTANGSFYILRPSAEGCEVLDRDELTTETVPEEIIASVAVARGRVYMVSRDHLYAIGPQGTPPPSADTVAGASTRRQRLPSEERVAQVLLVPNEVQMAPGEEVRFEARLFDPDGNWIRTVKRQASWSTADLQGTSPEPGTFRASSETVAQTGSVRAMVTGVEGAARVRVIPKLPWEHDFDALERVPVHWIGATGKFEPRELDGARVLVKKADNPFLKRAKVYMGSSQESNYTVEVDASSMMQRRRMGDVGLFAQRYAMILFGGKQKVELGSWQPETTRTVSASYTWQPDTWYRLKLSSENLPNGDVRVRGKVWPRGEVEPADWLLEKIDPLGNLQGSPGLYADAHVEVMFDNLKVYSQQ